MSWVGAYRDIKVEYDSDDGWDLESEGFCPTTTDNITDMYAAQLQAIISGAVIQALAEQETGGETTNAKLARGSTTSGSLPVNNRRPKHSV